jgi:hypothetical protein
VSDLLRTAFAYLERARIESDGETERCCSRAQELLGGACAEVEAARRLGAATH